MKVTRAAALLDPNPVVCIVNDDGWPVGTSVVQAFKVVFSGRRSEHTAPFFRQRSRNRLKKQFINVTPAPFFISFKRFD